MQHQTVPQSTGVIATIRSLLAAGWRNDSVHQMANGDTVRTMLHPTGREITTSTGAHDVDTKLTLTGLTLDQVAGAINGAGLAPRIVEPPAAEPGPHQELAAALHRLADDIAHHELPLPSYRMTVRGALPSRADLERWADFLGTNVEFGGTGGDIPVTGKTIAIGGWRDLHIEFQSPAEQRQPEVDRLRTRVAELEAQLAEGGDPR